MVVKLLVLVIFCFSTAYARTDTKLFNMGVGASIGVNDIATDSNFRFFPYGNATGDNSMAKYRNSGLNYGLSAYLLNGINWIPNYKFEYWNNSTSNDQGGSNTKSFHINEYMNYFYYTPVNTKLFFMDVGTIYDIVNFKVNSYAIDNTGTPTNAISQNTNINTFLIYFNFGFEVAGFIPSLAIGLPSSLADRVSLISVKLAYNFIKMPVDMSVYLGYDYTNYNMNDNENFFGDFNNQKIYLGVSLGGGI